MSFKLRQRTDIWFGLIAFALVLFGLVMIYSAGIVVAETYHHNSSYFVTHQLGFLLAGLVLWVAAAWADYRIWQKNGVILFAASLILLIPLALHLVRPINGAWRWYDLGVANLQPTEFLKLGFIFYLSALFASRGKETKTLNRGFGPFMLVLAALALLVMRQPDLGTMLVLTAIGFAIYFVAGADPWHLLAGLGVGALAVLLLISTSEYRANRLKAFLHPAEDSQSTGYHNNQALIAIGSGGLLGRGFGGSIQKHLYLPEPQTDSIFAVIVEELGALRAGILLLCFAALAWRGYLVAARAPDDFGRFVALGITTWLVFQALLNMAAMLQVVPLTGVPLPFVSYGGSNLLASLVAVGVIINISKQSKNYV